MFISVHTSIPVEGSNGTDKPTFIQPKCIDILRILVYLIFLLTHNIYKHTHHTILQGKDLTYKSRNKLPNQILANSLIPVISLLSGKQKNYLAFLIFTFPILRELIYCFVLKGFLQGCRQAG